MSLDHQCLDVLKGCDTGISGSPFHQDLFDLTPLLEHELVLHPVGIIRESNFVGKGGNKPANNG
jgi:hypothetical protein